MTINKQPLKAIVFAAVAHAGMQVRHQLDTRFGLANAGRRVEDEFPAELAAPEIANACEIDGFEQQRRRQIVLSQIREFTTVPQYVELIERRLFRGESIACLAAELGIRPATARSKVMRAKQYLHLTR